MSKHLQQLEIDWEALAMRELTLLEGHFGFRAVLDTYILAEVIAFTEKGLDSNYTDFKPNAAKIAGMFSFWFRKLKPISFEPDTKNRFLAVNEFVALKIGLGICQRYRDDLSNPDFNINSISTRLVQDWVNSLRAHSHSPNGTIMSFELIAAH